MSFIFNFAFGALILMTGLSAAIAESREIARPDAPSDREEVFVLMGGFGSCATTGEPSWMNMYDPFNETVSKVASARKIKATSFHACYAIGNSPLYVMDETNEVYSSSIGELSNWLISIYKARDVRFHLVGQSHGGWAVMMLALSLPPRSVLTMATLDPISQVDCGPFDYIASTSSSVFLGEPSLGCTSAPQDLAPYYPRLSRDVRMWSNFWQNQYSLLHSSPIAGAHDNLHVQLPDNSGSLAGAHFEIEIEPLVWEHIAGKMLKAPRY